MRKWNIVYDQSNTNYAARNKIIYKTEVLKSNLCKDNDTCILAGGNITIIGHSKAIQVAFKSCGLCVSQKLIEQKEIMMKTYTCQCIIC